MCMGVCLLICLSTTCMPSARGGQKMLSDALGLVIGSYEPPCGCRESKLGLPEEQPALLTAAPLQPLKIGGLSFQLEELSLASAVEWRIWVPLHLFIQSLDICAVHRVRWACSYLCTRGDQRMLLGMGSPWVRSSCSWELNSNLAACCLTTEPPCQSCFSISERQMYRMFLSFHPFNSLNILLHFPVY